LDAPRSADIISRKASMRALSDMRQAIAPER
jgi:hypothetical protein